MYHLDCTLIDNAEDLDVVIRMYNLLEYSHHFSMTSGSLWNYCRDEIDDVDDNDSDGKSFKYKTKIVGRHHEYPYGLEIKEMQINDREYQ